MASMKTMMSMVLDVGSSMSSVLPGQSGTKLELAKAFLGHYILQRMMASKTVEFSVVAFGDDVTQNYLNETSGEYEGVREVLPMERPSNQSLQLLHDIKGSEQTGDLINGIIVGQDILMRVNAGKAFNRLMLVVTDGETEVEGAGDLETIVAQMKSVKNFGLYIAMVGKVREDSSIVKKENAKLLQSLADSTSGRFLEMEQLGESFHLLCAGLGLGTKPQLAKTTLEISPELKFPCVCWGKVSKSTLPSLKKQVKVKQEDDVAAAFESSIKRDISYRNPEDPDDEIPMEERVKGFKYGAQYVPVSSADEEKFKIPGAAQFQVIGFLAQSKIPRFHLLEGPNYLHPSQEIEVVQKVFSSFVDSLRKAGKVALARHVKRDSSDPYLAVLMPLSNLDNSCVQVFRLPCAEDIREYNYPSLILFASDNLVKANANLARQKSCVSALLDSLTLPAKADSTRQLTTPINPVLHRVYAEIHRRIIDVPAESMVAVEEGFSAVQSDKSAAVVENLKQLFPLEKLEKSSGKKRVFWSDIEIKTSENGENKQARVDIDGQLIAAALSQAGEVAAVKEEDRDAALDLPEFHVGSITPIEDFEALLEAIGSLAVEQQKEKIVGAMQTLVAVVERNVTVGASRPHYKRAVQCLQALRKSSMQHQESSVFNDFMRNVVKAHFFKGRHALVWQLITEDALTLINSEEVSTSSVSKAEQQQFLSEVAVIEAPVATVVVADEEEDLFGNMA